MTLNFFLQTSKSAQQQEKQLRSNTVTIVRQSGGNRSYGPARPVVPEGAGVAMAPPDFCRPFNPISTKWDRLCPPNNTGIPGLSELLTALPAPLSCTLETNKTEKLEVYIISHGKQEGELTYPLALYSLLAKLEKETFENLPINKPLDIGELAKFASKRNSDSKSTKAAIEGWIEQKIGTEKKALVMIDEVPAKSIFQPHVSIKEKWEDLKKNCFENAGSVPLAFDICFLSKYKNIQFVILMTPSNYTSHNDFPPLFEFQKSEYGERKINEIAGSYHYDKLAPGKLLPLNQLSENCNFQFYHHLSARYRNCAEIMDFIKFFSKKEKYDKQLNVNHDKPLDPSELPQSYPLPVGLKPVIWFQGLIEPDFKDFNDLMDLLEKSSQPKLQLSEESVTIMGDESECKRFLKSVLKAKVENEGKESEIYQYLMNKAEGVEQKLMAKDEKFAKWNYIYYSLFNGAEDDIIVCITKYCLYLPVITRARKLLVIMTFGQKYQEENRGKNPERLPMMEEAFAKKLVTKFPF